MIKPFVADSAPAFHDSYIAVEEMERGVHEKFTLKLEELTFVEEQVKLLNDLLNGVFQQLQQAVGYDEDLLTAENLNASRLNRLLLEVRKSVQ